MIIGGAIGNVVDRLIHGHVVDFLLFYWQNWFYPSILTFADSFYLRWRSLLGIRWFAAQKNTFKRHKGRLKTEHT